MHSVCQIVIISLKIINPDKPWMNKRIKKNIIFNMDVFFKGGILRCILYKKNFKFKDVGELKVCRY